MGVLGDHDICAAVCHAVEACAHDIAVIMRVFNAAVIQHDQHITVLFQRLYFLADPVFIIEIHACTVGGRLVFKLLGRVVERDLSALMGERYAVSDRRCIFAPSEPSDAVFVQRSAGIGKPLCAVVHRMGIAEGRIVDAELFDGGEGAYGRFDVRTCFFDRRIVVGKAALKVTDAKVSLCKQFTQLFSKERLDIAR